MNELDVRIWNKAYELERLVNIVGGAKAAREAAGAAVRAFRIINEPLLNPTGKVSAWSPNQPGPSRTPVRPDQTRSSAKCRSFQAWWSPSWTW